MLNHKQIAELIAKSKKKTPAKVYVQGKFQFKDFKGFDFQVFGQEAFWVLIGDYPLIEVWMNKNRKRIKYHHAELAGRNSALPLLDLRKIDARVEPGAIIRDGARIGKDCVVMMGAIINIGAEVGQGTMVDMNAVIGARAIIGEDCHIGAGAVIAGVLEPPSREPVLVDDNVFIGANAVVLEAVRIGKGSVVAAGAVVLKDVPAGVVVAGVPARIIKKVEEIAQKEKIQIVKSLRQNK